MSWNTEKDFGKFVIDKLKSEGLHTMRIESASTITGCPDMYVQGAGDDYFIELKNVKLNVRDKCTVPWRPGQQAWALSYLMNHESAMTKYAFKQKHSWTFVGCSDKVLLIRMDSYIKDNVVYTVWSNVYEYSIDEFKSMSLKAFLEMYTYSVKVCMPALLKRRESCTIPYPELVAYYMDRYTEIFAGNDWHYIDVEPPECTKEHDDLIVNLDNMNIGIAHNEIIETVYSAVQSYKINEKSLL